MTHPHPPISYFFDKKLTDEDKKWLSDPYSPYSLDDINQLYQPNRKAPSFRSGM